MKRIRSALTEELPFLCSIPALLWQTLFLLVPFLIIVYFSITKEFTIYFWRELTWNYYINLLDPIYLRIIVRSLILAAGTATICFFCAYPVAYFLALRIQKWKNFFLFLLTLPFWTNFLVQIYSWFFLLERNGLINIILLKLGIIHEPLLLANSMVGIFIVMIYCYLPFMIMPLYSTLTKIDIRLLEASADLGATPWQTFRRITLPLSLPGIQTGFLLVLVPAFGEFAIPALLGGSKYMLVGSLISYYFLVARNNSQGAAFTIVSGLILLLVAWLLYRLFHIIMRQG